MSRTIDERVLQMEFDNKRFEKGAQESIATLEKLNKSCQLEGASSGITGLQKAIDNINSHFTIMGRLSERVMDTIVDKVQSTVSQITHLTKSLSLDQITSGFEKYETITASTNTIMGALSDADKKIISERGISEIDYVTEQLKRMNQYTDETSYNLVDMTGNVGKFMSAGIDLQTAVSAMEGIGNWAARSGANVNEASRAMYNLSQAMGVGYVQLMDWKSIENANMATKEFKEQVIATAKAMGTLDSSSDVTYKNFNSTLSDKWFTSEVLTKVLDDYNEFYNQLLKIQESEEGAGMSITDIVGELQDNTEQGAKWIKQYGIDLDSLAAKSFLAAQEYKSFSDVISAVQDAVSTSWMNIFQDIFGNLEESKDLWLRVGADFSSIFVDPISHLQTVFDNWKEIGGRNVLLEAFDNLRKAVDSIVSPIKQAFADIFGEFASEKGAAGAASKLLVFTQNLREFTEQMIISDDAGQGLRTVFREIFRVLDIGLGTFKDLVNVGIKVVKFFADVVEGIFGFINGLETGEGYLDSFNKCGESMSNIFEAVGDTFDHLTTKLSKIPILGKLVTWSKQIASVIGGTLKQWIDWLLVKFEELTGIHLEFKIPSAKQIVETLTNIGRAVKNLWDVFSKDFDASTPIKFLESIGNGLLAVYNEIKKFIDKKYTEFMAKDGQLQQFFKWIGNVKDTSTEGLKKTGEGLKQFGENVKTFFSGVNWKMIGEIGIVSALGVIIVKFKAQIDKLLGLGKDLKTTFTDTFTQPFKSFSKAMNAAATDMKADALVKAAEAITLLVVSLTLLGRLDSDQLARCTVSLLALMLGLSKLVNAKSNRDIAKGMQSLTSIKDVLADFADGVVKSLKTAAITAVILTFVATLTALAVVLRLYAGIEWETLGKAGAVLLSLTVAFTVLTGIVGAMQNLRASNLLALAAVIAVIAPSLGMLASAAKKFEEIKDVTALQNTIGAVTGFLSLLLVAASVSNKLAGGQNGLKGISAAVLSLTTSVLLLGTLSTISSKGIAGMTAMIFNMAVAMGALVAAAVFINKKDLIPSIEKLVDAMGKLTGFATAMTTFNLSLAALMAVFSIFPDGLGKVAKSIKDNAKTIAIAIVEVFTMVLTALAAYKFKYVAGILSFVVAVVEMVKDQSDQIIDPLMEILGDVLTAAADFIDSAVQYVVPAIVRVVNSIADAIRANSQPILSAIGNLWDAAVSLVSEGISGFTGLDLDFVKDLVDFAGKAGIVVAGISKISKALGGLSGASGASGASGGNFLTNAFKSIVSTPANIVNNVKAFGTILGTLRQGIFNTGATVADLGASLGTTGLAGVLGKATGAVGSGIAMFAQFAPQIAAVTAAVSGLLIISKKQQKAWEDGYKQRYGISDSYQAIIDKTKEYQETMKAEQEQYANNVSAIEDKWNAYEELGLKYDNLEDKSGNVAQSIIDELGNALSLNGDQVQELIDKYGSLQEGIRVYTALVEANDLKTTMKENLDSEKDSLKTQLDNYEASYDSYKEALQKYNDERQKYLDYINGEAQGKTKDQWLADYQTANNASIEQAQQAWDSLKEYYMNNLESLHKTVGEMYKNYQEYVDDISIYEKHKEQYEKLNELIDKATEDGNTANREALQAYMDLLNQESAEFATAGESTAAELIEQVKTQQATLEKAFELDLPSDFIDDDIATLKLAYQQLGESGKQALQEAITEATSAGNTDLATALQGILDTFDSGDINTEKVEVAGKEIGASAWSGILSSLSSGETDVSTAVGQIEQQLGGSLSSLFGTDGALNIQNMLNNVSSGSLDISSLLGGVTFDQDALNSTIQSTVTEPIQQSISTGVSNAKISDEAITTLSATTGTAIQTGVKTGMESLTADQLVPSEYELDFGEYGKNIDTSMATGMTDNAQVVQTAAITVTNTGKSGLESVDTTSSGTNFLAGFARGLDSFSGAIGRKCYQLGKSFVSKFNKGLDEHSPSKATAKSGVFFLKGFIKGIQSYNSTASKVVTASAEDMVGAFNDSLSYINGIVTDNLDTNPRITPVLDLSQVQNGSAQLASMLGLQQTYRTAAAVATGFTSPVQQQADSINQSMSTAMADLIAAQQQQAQDQTFTFNIPLDVNGRQIAKATRTYTQAELNNLSTIMNRKGGVRG